MSSQALAGASVGLTIALALCYVPLFRLWRRSEARHEAEVDHLRDRAYRDLQKTSRDVMATRASRDVARSRAESAERKVEELELALARRRHGPLEEGELVALTTPDDRTVKGIVRQTFDTGAVLLGGAVVYVEEAGRDGTVSVREERAGDVAVPSHVWAQKLPPEPLAKED